MTYADKAIMMLLPELEKGLFDENWRIRHSSIQLLGKIFYSTGTYKIRSSLLLLILVSWHSIRFSIGDLLYKVSGVSGKMTTETASEDDNFGTEQSQKVCNYKYFRPLVLHSF